MKTQQIRRRLTAMLCLLTIILSQTACGDNGGNGSGQSGKGEQPVSETDFLLNTVCKIDIYQWASDDRNEAEELIREGFQLGRQLERKMSRTIEGSDIDRINKAQGQPVEIDDERVIEVLQLAVNYGDMTGGLFDVTVGRLVELWNFSAQEEIVPDDSLIQEALPHIDYRNLSWEPVVEGDPMGQTGDSGANRKWMVQLSDPEAVIDLGGIAKGYIADQVADLLRARGVTRGIVNFGGNAICIGEREPGVPWRIGIERPFSGTEGSGGLQKSMMGTIEARDMAAVTSGTYERMFIKDGVLYHHILDPATGYPRKTDLDSVTIVGERSADCDGLSTSCLMLGLEKGMELVKSRPGFEAIFITKDGEVVSTDGIALTPVQ